VRFKEVYYKKAGLLVSWQHLQRNDKWPVKLSQFWDFTGEAEADLYDITLS